MLNKSRQVAANLKRLLINPGVFFSAGMNAVKLNPKGYSKHILVHTMAKVGSKTIVRSIEAAAPDAYLQITHTLAPDSLHRAEPLFKQSGHWGQLDKSRVIGRHVRSKDSKIQWRVISPVRDPIARDISFFFESIPILYPDLVQCDCADKLTQVFLAQLEEDGKKDYVPHPVHWFDEEILPTFGIDVFSRPFDFDIGFSTYQSENAQLVVIRLEDFERSLGKALSFLLNEPTVEIKDANRASQKKRKKVYDVYQEFRQKLVLPASYVDKLYTSKFCTHFYRPDEIAKFRGNWQSKD